MYVCLCNAITDRAVRTCAEGGCPTVSSVYRSLGARPKCGKCAPLVLKFLRRAVETPDARPAAAAVAN
jgi:bacterioferritin-associated ferredoxin